MSWEFILDIVYSFEGDTLTVEPTKSLPLKPTLELANINTQLEVLKMQLAKPLSVTAAEGRIS